MCIKMLFAFAIRISYNILSEQIIKIKERNIFSSTYKFEFTWIKYLYCSIFLIWTEENQLCSVLSLFKFSSDFISCTILESISNVLRSLTNKCSF